MTRPAAFRQADLTRAVRGVQAAGVEQATIRLRPGGEIVIHIGGGAAAAVDGDANEWDEVLDAEQAQAPPAA